MAINHHQIAVATVNGFCIIDKQSGTVKPYATTQDLNEQNASAYIISMLFNDDGTVWLGTEGGGLSLYNMNTHELKTFTTHEGMLSDDVYSLQRDSQGGIWASTGKGLAIVKDFQVSNLNYIYDIDKVYNKSSGSFVKDIAYERNTDRSSVDGASSSAYYKLVFCTRNCIYVLNNNDTVSQYINDDVRNVFAMNDGKIFIQHYDELDLHNSPSSISSYSISASMNNTIGVEQNNKIFTYDNDSGKSCFVDSSGNKTLITSSYFDSNSDRDNVCSDGYRIYTIGSNNTLVILESNGTEKTKQFTPIANTQNYRAITSNENYLYVSGYNSSTTRNELIVLSNLR